MDQCFGDEETSFYIRKKTESIIRSEIKKMCSQEVNSILQRIEIQQKLGDDDILCTSQQKPGSVLLQIYCNRKGTFLVTYTKKCTAAPPSNIESWISPCCVNLRHKDGFLIFAKWVTYNKERAFTKPCALKIIVIQKPQVGTWLMSCENVNLAIVFPSPLADQTTNRIIVDLVNVKCEELCLRRGSALACR